MINIAVLTATRAEYGLMRQLIFKLRDDPEFSLNLLVTGTHLSDKYGMTVNEIIDDDVPIAFQQDILVEINGEIDVTRTMARALEIFSVYFSKNKFDLLFVDGDRYETLAVCIAAINNNIPIAHCGGGATTEGANDEYWRHAITKLSYLHFPTTELYKKRIINMGEEPHRVCVSGSPGLENIRIMKLAVKDEVKKRIGIKTDIPYAMVTFHPVTLENDTFLKQAREMLEVCGRLNDIFWVFTKANADRGGNNINQILQEYCDENKEKAKLISSLGAYYYLSALKYCEFVMGNSSSGIIEAPSFGIPTINIGDRQKGRERADSIIDCDPYAESILAAIKKARDEEFKNRCKSVVNPYGDGHASDIILSKIKEIYNDGGLRMEKHFYDPVSVDE